MSKEKKPTKPTEKPAKVAKPRYTLEVSVNDVEYKGSGESMVEALAGFVASPSFPFGIKTRVLLKFSDGVKSASQVYSASMARRIFKVASKKLSAIEIMARKMVERLS